MRTPLLQEIEKVPLGVFEADDVVLNEGIIIDIDEMKLEPPRHGDTFFLVFAFFCGEIGKVGNAIVNFGRRAFSLYSYFKAIV